MKLYRIKIVTIILILVSIASFLRADEPKELAEMTRELLGRASYQDGSKIKYESGKVIIGKKSIIVRPISEHVLEDAGRFISAARFEVSVDGSKRPQLTFGAIGIGESREDATNRAVVEWYMTAGQPIFAAIGEQVPQTSLGELAIYPGLMGGRGERPEGWLDGTPEMNQRIFGVLKEFILSKKMLMSVDLKILVEGDVVKGQCLIDGKESALAFNAIRKLTWPKANASYMFKQSYIIAPNFKVDPE